MWTKNGKKMFLKQLSTTFTNSSASNFLVRGCTDADITWSYNYNISGVHTSLDELVYSMTANAKSSNLSYAYKWLIYLGTGTTPPAEDDIILENPVTFTCPVVPQISRGNNYTTLLITYTFTNNTDTTQTITEIGLCARVNTLTSGTGSPAVLFNRRLLENPITMEAGESKVFTFTIDTTDLSD